METKNARVHGVRVGLESDGCLSVFVALDYGDGSVLQGFGGTAIYCPNLPDRGGKFLADLLAAVGVDELDRCAGQSVRVIRSETGVIEQLGHLFLDDRWVLQTLPQRRATDYVLPPTSPGTSQ